MFFVNGEFAPWVTQRLFYSCAVIAALQQPELSSLDDSPRVIHYIATNFVHGYFWFHGSFRVVESATCRTEIEIQPISSSRAGNFDWDSAAYFFVIGMDPL